MPRIASRPPVTAFAPQPALPCLRQLQLHNANQGDTHDRKESAFVRRRYRRCRGHGLRRQPGLRRLAQDRICTGLRTAPAVPVRQRGQARPAAVLRPVVTGSVHGVGIAGPPHPPRS
uniref:Uncharacterized protein n=1 Tax=Stenotrophomonas maltophilia TaxID=40324 RepID=A0A0A0R1L5_STEMA|nr:hypothetical protein [Stenotrophomonas maltophilia]